MKTIDYRGYTAVITTHHDQDMGEPWVEHDGHGIVSDWTTRDKRPGEMILASDRNSRRFYDFQGTLAIARRDHWGLGADHIAKLAKKLGRHPTVREIRIESVLHDFYYLRRWCNDEWQWQGYTTEITSRDGNVTTGDSCWGYDNEDYMLGEAETSAQHSIDQLILVAEETQYTENAP